MPLKWEYPKCQEKRVKKPHNAASADYRKNVCWPAAANLYLSVPFSHTQKNHASESSLHIFLKFSYIELLKFFWTFSPYSWVIPHGQITIDPYSS